MVDLNGGFGKFKIVLANGGPERLPTGNKKVRHFIEKGGGCAAGLCKQDQK